MILNSRVLGWKQSLTLSQGPFPTPSLSPLQTLKFSKKPSPIKSMKWQKQVYTDYIIYFTKSHIFNHNVYIFNKLIKICFLIQYQMGESKGRTMDQLKMEFTNLHVKQTNCSWNSPTSMACLQNCSNVKSLMVCTKYVKLMVRERNIFMIIK